MPENEVHLWITDEEARSLLRCRPAHIMIFGEVKTASAIRGLAAQLLDARMAIQRIRDLAADCEPSCSRTGDEAGPSCKREGCLQYVMDRDTVLALLPPEVSE